MPIDWDDAEQYLFNRTLITKARKSAGMTRKSLAQTAKVSPQTISNIEGASYGPTGELRGCKTRNLLKVAQVLGIPREALSVVPSLEDPSACVDLKSPNTINFRPSQYPGNADHNWHYEEPWQRSAMMFICCPLQFDFAGISISTATVERVFASINVMGRELLYELRTWADLSDGRQQIKALENSIASTNDQPKRSEEQRSAYGNARRAWAAQAVSPLTNSTSFQPFQLSEKSRTFSMEACFASSDQGISWTDFCDYFERDDVPEQLKITIGAVVSDEENGTYPILCRTSIELRCLRRIKRWVEDRAGEDYFVRHLQPRSIEGKEKFCGRQGHCCFTPGDECSPTRTK